MMDEETRKALGSALKMLSIKSRHSSEIKAKLFELGYGESIVKSVIQELSKLGYIDDQDWIECFVRSQTAKKFGRHAILQKLFLKGIPKEQVLPVVDKYQSEEKQKELIASLLKTRYRLKDLDDFRQKQQVAAGLARRGFSFSLIQQAFGSFS